MADWFPNGHESKDKNKDIELDFLSIHFEDHYPIRPKHPVGIYDIR